MKIHLIDDDIIAHQFYMLQLKTITARIDFESFYNGKDAIEFLINRKDHYELVPDIIILDINMPIMDGWGYLEYFKSIEKELAKIPKIFIVSGCLMNDNKMEVINSIQGFLTKPMTIENWKKVLISVEDVEYKSGSLDA